MDESLRVQHGGGQPGVAMEAVAEVALRNLSRPTPSQTITRLLRGARRLCWRAPPPVTVIPSSLICGARRAIRRETGLLEHSPQIHQLLDVDVLTMRRR